MAGGEGRGGVRGPLARGASAGGAGPAAEPAHRGGVDGGLRDRRGPRRAGCARRTYRSSADHVALSVDGAGHPDPSTPPRVDTEETQRSGGFSGGACRTPNTSRSATRAALSPQAPCTAGPGGVAAEARYTPATGVL